MAAVAITAIPVAAQYSDFQTGPAPATLWNYTYNLHGSGWANSLCPTADGGYALTGVVITSAGKYDMFVIKTDAGGNDQWTNSGGTWGYNEGNCIIQSSDGSYVIVGSSSQSAAAYTDITLMKIPGDSPAKGWTLTFGKEWADQGNAVIEANGGYMVAGSIFNRPNYEGFIARINNSGEELWTRMYAEKWNDIRFYAIGKVTDGSGYIVAGTLGSARDKIYLLRIEQDGSEFWSQSFDAGGIDCEVGDVRQTTDGGFIITGSRGNYSQFLLRTDHEGKMLWYKEYSNFGRQFCGTVQQMPSGGFIAGGACLVRTDDDGNLLWSTLADPAFTSWRTAVVANPDGTYTVAGGGLADDNRLKPMLARTMPEERVKATIQPAATPASGSAPFTLPSLNMGWVGTLALALGTLVLLGGLLIVILIIVIIVDEHRNRPRKP